VEGRDLFTGMWALKIGVCPCLYILYETGEQALMRFGRKYGVHAPGVPADPSRLPPMYGGTAAVDQNDPTIVIACGPTTTPPGGTSQANLGITNTANTHLLTVSAATNTPSASTAVPPAHPPASASVSTALIADVTNRMPPPTQPSCAEEESVSAGEETATEVADPVRKEAGTAAEVPDPTGQELETVITDSTAEGDDVPTVITDSTAQDVVESADATTQEEGNQVEIADYTAQGVGIHTVITDSTAQEIHMETVITDPTAQDAVERADATAREEGNQVEIADYTAQGVGMLTAITDSTAQELHMATVITNSTAQDIEMETEITDRSAQENQHPETSNSTDQEVQTQTEVARCSTQDDDVYDSFQFLDAMRSEAMFGVVDADDVNISSHPIHDDDDESVVDTEDAVDGVMVGMDEDEDEEGNLDEEEGNGDVTDAFGLTQENLRAMSEGGWTIYDEIESREFIQEAATDYYDGEPRPTKSAAAFASSPLGMFFYFLPKALWVRIAEETNRYRESMVETMAADRQRGQQRRLQQSHSDAGVQSLQAIRDELNKWKPVQPHEIVHFIGLLLARSLSPQRASLSKHWSVSEEGAVPRGTFNRFMTRKRFKDIVRFLHFNDNSDDRRMYDRAWKVRPVLQVVEKTFRRGFVLGKRISFDEGMVGSRHQYNPMRIYMKDKPTKWGTKFYMTCCADTAYCSRWVVLCCAIQHRQIAPFDELMRCAVLYSIEIYRGSNGPEDHAIARTVLRNVMKAFGPSRHDSSRKRLIVTDNYYTSVSLSDELYKRGFYHVGTTRTNRLGWPKTFSFKFKSRPRSVQRGAYRIAQNKSIPHLLAVSWCDARTVNFLASGCSTEPTVLQRKEKDGTRVNVGCPQLVADYTTGMAGVDQHDQLRLHRYSIQKSVRMLKYYKSIFLGIVDMAIVNGFIIHRLHKKEETSKPPTHAEYVSRLHQELLGALYHTEL
jgi:hypothetical protein